MMMTMCDHDALQAAPDIDFLHILRKLKVYSYADNIMTMMRNRAGTRIMMMMLVIEMMMRTPAGMIMIPCTSPLQTRGRRICFWTGLLARSLVACLLVCLLACLLACLLTCMCLVSLCACSFPRCWLVVRQLAFTSCPLREFQD